MKGLTRCDYPQSRTFGWYARIYLLDKRIISKYFADKLNGGKINAEKIALAWLRIYREIYQVQLSSKVYRKGRQINNKSGKTGVHRSFTTKKYKGHTFIYYYYVATWAKQGERKHKAFYIHKYPSIDDAFWAAVEYRNLMEQRLEIGK